MMNSNSCFIICFQFLFPHAAVQWNTYAFTKFVPYDQVATYEPPPLEHPSDVLPGGYTRAERHLLVGLGECLDPMLEITTAYLNHLKDLGQCKRCKPLTTRVNAQIEGFIAHLRANEASDTVVDIDDEEYQNSNAVYEDEAGGTKKRSVFFVRRFSEQEDAFLLKHCSYARSFKPDTTFWTKLFAQSKNDSTSSPPLLDNRGVESIQVYVLKQRKLPRTPSN